LLKRPPAEDAPADVKEAYDPWEAIEVVWDVAKVDHDDCEYVSPWELEVRPSYQKPLHLSSTSSSLQTTFAILPKVLMLHTLQATFAILQKVVMPYTLQTTFAILPKVLMLHALQASFGILPKVVMLCTLQTTFANFSKALMLYTLQTTAATFPRPQQQERLLNHPDKARPVTHECTQKLMSGAPQ
jgi:hypothetical protein